VPFWPQIGPRPTALPFALCSCIFVLTAIHLSPYSKQLLTSVTYDCIRDQKLDMAAEDFNLSVRFASYTVTIDCPSGNDYDGRLGLRISAIFVIFIGSLLGCLVPMLLASSSELLASKALFVIKYFGSGVIVGTAFIHLLAPAVAALHSPCLNPESPISRYPWPEGICLMTVFAMFLAELLVRLYATNMRVHSAVEQLSVNVSPLGNNSKSAEGE